MSTVDGIDNILSSLSVATNNKESRLHRRISHTRNTPSGCSKDTCNDSPSTDSGLREACGLFGCVLASEQAYSTMVCKKQEAMSSIVTSLCKTNGSLSTSTVECCLTDGNVMSSSSESSPNSSPSTTRHSTKTTSLNHPDSNNSNGFPMHSVKVADVIQMGLVALQHRGQESAGIVTSAGKGVKQFNSHKGQGLVTHIFNDENMAALTGNVGLGHTRYSTTGGTDAINTQPFVVHTRHGPIAVAHNGELINADTLRQIVLERGFGLSTNSDSELITQVLALTPLRGEKSGPDWAARIRHLMEATPLAYSLAIMHGEKLYGVRDSFGNRPLCIGKLLSVGHFDSKETVDPDTPLGWVLSSESSAFSPIGAVYIREVRPGEIVELSPRGLRTLDVVPRPADLNPLKLGYDNHSLNESPPAFCIFEYVYFARPDSIFEGQQVYSVRQRCGVQLALEAPAEADIVSTVPESATPSALGFSQQSGLPYVEVLCKNRYIGRSFIQPSTRARQLAVAKKFGAITENLAGRRVVLVDDSIVRGTTLGPIIKLLKEAGAKEVHIRVASPPIRHPCYMGINIPTKEELIANRHSPENLAKHFGADSLEYLSIEGLKKAVQQEAKSSNGGPLGHCTACLDGQYPVPLEW